MTWRQRARKKFRAEVLASLFPRLAPVFSDERVTPLFVVVPVEKNLLVPGTLNRRERAQVCESVGMAALYAATQAVRRRVGSSAISDADRVLRGWTATA